MIPARFEYVRPASLDEALVALVERHDARLLAGGQSLLTVLKLRQATPSTVIDISGLDELVGSRLTGTASSGQTLRIGAMTTLARVIADPMVAEHAPVLAAASRLVADVQVRNRSTIGGCLAWADPAGDLAAAVLAAGGSVEATSPSGVREISAAELFVSPFVTSLRADEIITALLVPAADGRSAAYHALARRPADPSIVSAAVVARVGDGGRLDHVGIGMAGVGPTPLALPALAASIDGRAVAEITAAEVDDAIAALVRPVSGPTGSAAYKRSVAGVVVVRALAELVATTRNEEQA